MFTFFLFHLVQGDSLDSVYNIKVIRLLDKTTPWGCVIADAQGFPIVSKGSEGDQCARFEVTTESDTPDGQGGLGRYRFKELYVHEALCSLVCSYCLPFCRSTRKLLRHGGDWIRFDGELGDTSDATLFIKQREEPYTLLYHLRPADSSTVIYADDNTGALNVKSEGFKMNFELEEYIYH